MTMVGIFKAKSTGKYSPFPYSAIFANASICTIYGFFGKNSDLIICNSPGIILAIIYLVIFWIYCEPCPRYQSICLFIILTVAISGTTVGLSFTSDDTSSSVFGILMDISGMIQYGSPLVKVYDVVKSQSSNGLPMPLTLGTLFCSACWSVYAIIKKDIFVLLLNGVGVVLALIQLSLFCIYPSKGGDKDVSGETILKSDEKLTAPSLQLLIEEDTIEYYEDEVNPGNNWYSEN